MPTRNISLTDHLDQFIERRITTGQYGNASEIVREALRLLEAREVEREAKLKMLRKVAKDAFADIDQGNGIVLGDREAIDAFLGDAASRAGFGRQGK